MLDAVLQLSDVRVNVLHCGMAELAAKQPNNTGRALRRAVPVLSAALQIQAASSLHPAFPVFNTLPPTPMPIAIAQHPTFGELHAAAQLLHRSAGAFTRLGSRIQLRPKLRLLSLQRHKRERMAHRHSVGEGRQRSGKGAQGVTGHCCRLTAGLKAGFDFGDTPA